MVALRISIHVATVHDAPLLAELGARTFRDTFAEENAETDMSEYLSAAFSHEVQTRELADPTSDFLIARVDGHVAGYARIRTGDAPACVSGARPMEIVRIYSDTPWIGKGVGPALMEACLAEAAARECDVVWLSVWEKNPRAIAFYSKWLFAPVGSQDFALGSDLQHDVVMARSVR